MLRVLCHVFLCFVSPFCSMLMLGLHAHMLDIMSMVMSCLDLHVCMHVLCPYTYIQVFTCLYAWIHVLPCLCAKFLHVYMYFPMPICLDLCCHMLVCLDLCSPHALCYLPCVCAHQAMLVCLALDLFVMPCAIATLLFILSHFLMFWPFGLNLI